jgi:hypothetical protein
MNEQGENVMEPVQGIAVDTLGNGRFLVNRDEKFCIIDENGEDLVILPDIDYGSLLKADVYRDGLLWVETSRLIKGFIDVDGNYVFGQNDVLDKIENIRLSSMTVSKELVELEPTEGVTDPTGEHTETPASSFEYDYGYCKTKLPDGNFDYVAAVIITKYVGNDEIVVIPSEIDGLPVLKIGESAFAGSKIRELYFAGNLTTIETHAFAFCRELTTVVLPDNWMDLGDKCFTGCSSLAQLELPADCTFTGEPVWNEIFGTYEYSVGSPISEDDSTVVVTREN